MGAMPEYRTVAEYLKAQPPGARKVLTRVRALIKKAAPGCKEVISYGIPGYQMSGRVGVFFAGWKEHFSLYPVTTAVREALGDALEPYQHGRGTLRFRYDLKLPGKLLSTVVRLRADEAAALTAAKTRKGKK